ncbi:MAG TPA: ribosome-associated translation inhibitor RaiA [Hellea balneolensis]|uniref:Ribosome hibernation promoting factor n=1 Tax=Hellea balneolensis TaxID=287478 RepID=A0A7V5U1A6_9PROT|nr:ribosome-associated translation inhibitor RaiA [Hellea balneolensis]
MQIHIVSKGIDVSPALSDRIKDRLEEMMDKYIHRDGEAHVSISKEGSGFHTVISAHLPSGATMQAQGQAQDAYVAADEALDHMEKRLRRYKRRLKDHQAEQKAQAMAMYILQNPVKETEDEDEDTPIAEPLVIAEKATEIRTMTVSMASLELGLTDSSAVVFNNAAHGGLNVVFKRADGNIGWIDPQRQTG